MELVIIKSGNDYIRVKSDAYLTVKLDKASVFPMDSVSTARQHAKNLVAAGFKDICIKKLVLSEEDL